MWLEPSCPPKAKAAVCVPVPPRVFLPVVRAFPDAHAPAARVLSKFHSSVVATTAVAVIPPKTIEDELG